MSLVQHLAPGAALDQWFAEHAPGLSELADQAAEQATTRDTVMPEHVELGPRGHFALVGGIVGARLADHVEPAPPYASLLGAIRCGALTPAQAAERALTYPTHHYRLEGAVRNLAHHVRTTPAGLWRTATEPGEPDPEAGSESVRTMLRQASLATQSGRTDIPALYVRDLLETVYRAGIIPTELQTLDTTGDVEVPAGVTEDALTVVQNQRQARDAVQQLAAGGPDGARGQQHPQGHASPLFVPGWAEGDVLVGPGTDGGYTLLDVKTVTRVADRTRVLSWLRQIVAYACLDAPGRWQIGRVGLWLPRQDLVVVWPIEQIFAAMRGNRDDLLASIRAVCWEAVRADGGNPRHLLALTGEINCSS